MSGMTPRAKATQEYTPTSPCCKRCSAFWARPVEKGGKVMLEHRRCAIGGFEVRLEGLCRLYREKA